MVMFLLFNKSIIIFSIYKCLKNEPISYTKIMFLSPNLIRIIKIPLKNNKFDLVISFISILFAAALQMSIPYYLGSSIDKSLDASSSSELSLSPFIEIGLLVFLLSLARGIFSYFHVYLGEKIGLSNDFVVQVIRATGNYGEIYERHLGQNSKVSIPRGLNELYNKGGIHISPPFN